MPQHLKYLDSSTNRFMCSQCFDGMVEYDESIGHDQVDPNTALRQLWWPIL